MLSTAFRDHIWTLSLGESGIRAIDLKKIAMKSTITDEYQTRTDLN